MKRRMILRLKLSEDGGQRHSDELRYSYKVAGTTTALSGSNRETPLVFLVQMDIYDERKSRFKKYLSFVCNLIIKYS